QLASRSGRRRVIAVRRRWSMSPTDLSCRNDSSPATNASDRTAMMNRMSAMATSNSVIVKPALRLMDLPPSVPFRLQYFRQAPRLYSGRLEDFDHALHDHGHAGAGWILLLDRCLEFHDYVMRVGRIGCHAEAPAET